MKLKEIVVSLEHAQALKKAGWKDETCFSWWIQKYGDYPQEPYVERTSFATINFGFDWDQHTRVAAPTAEEILRKLPPSVMVGGEMLHLGIFDDRDWIGESSWDLGYSISGMTGKPLHVRSKNSFVDACAKMYCYLAENNLLPPSTENNNE